MLHQEPVGDVGDHPVQHLLASLAQPISNAAAEDDTSAPGGSGASATAGLEHVAQKLSMEVDPMDDYDVSESPRFG